jgi:hypothetical protein
MNVQQLFAQSRSGLIGVQLKLPSVHLNDAIKKIAKFKSLQECQQHLKEYAMFYIYLKKDESDDQVTVTMSNGLCLIDTLRRIKTFGSNNTTTCLKTTMDDISTFLEELIGENKRLLEEEQIFEKDQIMLLAENTEILQAMQDFVKAGVKNVFQPFPNDDLTRFLFPQIPRVLIQELEERDNVKGIIPEAFNRLVSINNVTSKGCFFYDQIEKILGMDEIFVFKLKLKHYWDSPGRKDWQQNTQKDFEEAFKELARKVIQLNENLSSSLSSSDSSSSSASSSSTSSSSSSTSTTSSSSSSSSSSFSSSSSSSTSTTTTSY